MLAEFYPEQLWLATAGKLGWLWIVPSVALLITIGNLGAAGGFLAATARIPFAVGIDKMLPPAFGKLHPRYGTPLAVIKIIGLTGLLLGIVGRPTRCPDVALRTKRAAAPEPTLLNRTPIAIRAVRDVITDRPGAWGQDGR